MTGFAEHAQPRRLVLPHGGRRGRGRPARPHGQAAQEDHKRNIAKFASRDNLQAFAKLTTEVDGVPRFASMPPLVVPLRELAAGEEFSHVDAESWIAGGVPTASSPTTAAAWTTTVVTSSVSTSTPTSRARSSASAASARVRGSCSCSGRDDGDPLILQFKEAGASVLEPHIGVEPVRPGRSPRRGRAAADAGDQRHLPGLVPRRGHRRGRALVLRAPAARREGQHRRRGHGPDPRWRRTPVSAPGRWPGRMPARATGSPSPPTSARLRLFDEAMVAFAHLYAEQNERDHAALVAAIDEGRITALARGLNPGSRAGPGGNPSRGGAERALGSSGASAPCRVGRVEGLLVVDVRPFRALRPAPGAAERLVSPPYDVVDVEEARAYAAGDPDSFLRVSRPEIDLPARCRPARRRGLRARTPQPRRPRRARRAGARRRSRRSPSTAR